MSSSTSTPVSEVPSLDVPPWCVMFFYINAVLTQTPTLSQRRRHSAPKSIWAGKRRALTLAMYRPSSNRAAKGLRTSAEDNPYRFVTRVESTKRPELPQRPPGWRCVDIPSRLGQALYRSPRAERPNQASIFDIEQDLFFIGTCIVCVTVLLRLRTDASTLRVLLKCCNSASSIALPR